MAAVSVVAIHFGQHWLLCGVCHIRSSPRMAGFSALGIVCGLFLTVLHIANLIHKRRKRLQSEKSGAL